MGLQTLAFFAQTYLYFVHQPNGIYNAMRSIKTDFISLKDLFLDRSRRFLQFFFLKALKLNLKI